jgi:hypothetical protein
VIGIPRKWVQTSLCNANEVTGVQSDSGHTLFSRLGSFLERQCGLDDIVKLRFYADA